MDAVRGAINFIASLDSHAVYESLANQITVSPVKDTQIISISVQDTNKERAKNIANEIPKVFAEEAKRITKANDVQVIDKAILLKDAVKPNKMMNVAIAAVLGFMLGLFIVPNIVSIILSLPVPTSQNFLVLIILKYYN